MSQPTQVELMNAHKTARNNALSVAANGIKTSTGVVLTPEATLAPFEQPYTIHPFSGNDNNKRVAQRIAASSQEEATQIEVKTQKQAAQDQLAKAAEYERANPDEKSTSGVIQPGTREALYAAVQVGSGAPAILPGLTPAVGESGNGTAPVPPAPPTPASVPPVPPVVPPAPPVAPML